MPRCNLRLSNCNAAGDAADAEIVPSGTSICQTYLPHLKQGYTLPTLIPVVIYPDCDPIRRVEYISWSRAICSSNIPLNACSSSGKTAQFQFVFDLSVISHMILMMREKERGWGERERGRRRVRVERERGREREWERESRESEGERERGIER